VAHTQFTAAAQFAMRQSRTAPQALEGKAVPHRCEFASDFVMNFDDFENSRVW